MRVFYHLFLLCELLVLSFSVTSCYEPERPNIIVIYTDDQGYGDMSLLNPEAKFETPNLDRMAEAGILFTNAHSADAVYTPSRYSLLTGRYCWRTEKKRRVLGAEAECLIADDRMTLASLLRDNGYAAGMVGKWHLGMDFPGTPQNRDWTKPVQDMLLDKGFEYFYGIPASLNYGVLVWFEGRYAKVPPTLYTVKKLNKRHVDYRIKPPYQETPEATREVLNRNGMEVAPDFADSLCLTRFTEKAIAWIDEKKEDAENGKPFFLYLAYTSPHYPVCPLPEFHGQGEAGAYGEFVIETDYHVGQVLDYLEESGLENNTLVVFSSDNGPENSWKQRIEDYGHHSNYIYREGKRSIYEGGHRVPFIVQWPEGIKRPGRTWDGIIGQVDLLATFAEITGAELPADGGVDSYSFADVLRRPQSKHERLPLINHSNKGDYAITEGNWKLIFHAADNRKALFNLADDPSEENDVAASHPEIVTELTKKSSDIVLNGRTTAGPVQMNDTEYWKDLTWITEEEYTTRQSIRSFITGSHTGSHTGTRQKNVATLHCSGTADQNMDLFSNNK